MKTNYLQSAVHKAQKSFGGGFAQEVRQHGAQVEHLLSKLAPNLKSPIAKTRNIAIKKLSRSYSLRLCALAASLKHDRITPEQIRIEAAGLDIYKECDEPISIQLKEKSGFFQLAKTNFSSDPLHHRFIASFGLRRRAKQLIVRILLAMIHSPSEWNYLAEGRGTEIASDKIKELIEQGFTNFVLADVKNFYPSVQQNKEVRKLIGLPQAIIQGVIFISPSAPIVLSGVPQGIDLQLFDGAARQGLPLGSPTSLIIADILYRRVLAQIAPADRIVLYGDDVAIAVSNSKEAMSTKLALTEALKSHPAGPFRHKHLEQVTIYEGFDFLKYRYKRNWFTKSIRRTPAGICYKRFKERLVKLAQVHPNDQALLIKYGKDWVRSFRRWHWNKLSLSYLYASGLLALLHTNETSSAAKDKT